MMIEEVLEKMIAMVLENEGENDRHKQQTQEQQKQERQALIKVILEKNEKT